MNILLNMYAVFSILFVMKLQVKSQKHREIVHSELYISRMCYKIVGELCLKRSVW